MGADRAIRPEQLFEVSACFVLGQIHQLLAFCVPSLLMVINCATFNMPVNN
jgi:hypothetical protein